MNYTIIYPSRSRPEICQQVINKWQETTRKFEVHNWVIAVDEDDPMLEEYKKVKFFGELRINKNRSCVDAINDAANAYWYSDLFMVISDDFEPFEFWDLALWDVVYDKIDFCLKTDDGLQPTLITLPIMDRAYYERFNYIYNPDYRHMFVDQEMTSVACMLGRYLKSNLRFAHKHYTTGEFKMDNITIRNNSSWQQGETLFNERLKTNFGIESPVMQYSEIQWR